MSENTENEQEEDIVRLSVSREILETEGVILKTGEKYEITLFEPENNVSE